MGDAEYGVNFLTVTVLRIGLDCLRLDLSVYRTRAEEKGQTGGRDSRAAKSRWDGTGGGVYLKGVSSCQHCLARLNAWE